MSNVSTEGLIFKVGKKSVPLSVEEARQLYNELHAMFGAPPTTIPIYIEREPRISPWPQPYWQPYCNDGTASPFPLLPKITC